MTAIIKYDALDVGQEFPTEEVRYGRGSRYLRMHQLVGYGPDVDFDTVELEAGRFLAITPDENSCPLFVGWKMYPEPVKYFGIEDVRQPMLRNCRSRACHRCSGIEAWRTQSDYSKLYAGNPDAWFFVTLTGTGWDTAFRHASLAQQIEVMNSNLKTFLKLNKMTVIDQPLRTESSSVARDRLTYLSDYIHELDESERSLKRKIKNLLKEDRPNMVEVNALEKLRKVAAYSKKESQQEVLLNLQRIEPNDSFHLETGDVSFIAAVETTLNQKLLHRKGGKSSMCRDCEHHGHWHTHLHLHIFSPTWLDAMRRVTPKNAPLWKKNKRGSLLPHRNFWKVIERNASIAGFGRIQIGKLNLSDDGTKTPDGVGYIFKNYIMKSISKDGTQWYRDQIKEAFRGRSRWWRTGPLWDEGNVKFPRLKQKRQARIASALRESSVYLEDEHLKANEAMATWLEYLSTNNSNQNYYASVPRLFIG